MGELHNHFIEEKKKQTAFYNESIAVLDLILQEMKAYLEQDIYLYEFDYSPRYNQWRKRANEVNGHMSNPVSFLRRVIYGLSSLKRQYDRRYVDCTKALSEFEQQVIWHNKIYMDREVTKAYEIVGKVEGRFLDRQQMESIIKNPHNQLVIAGAGTGKTTTIIGKVKYLLGNNFCKPEEICVLSFTNAAAAEMKNRLYAETQEEIHVSTFHSLGMDILRQADHRKPNIYSGNIHDYILTRIEEHLKEPEYARLMMTYLLFNQASEKSEFDFKDQKTYEEYLKLNPPTTILGEQVKSYGEMEIANWFSQYGIQYEYEAEYVVDTRTEEYGQYRPDFYLPDYGIYVEYFGINRKNEVPGYFHGKGGKSASEVYMEGMEWKRKIHRENNTTLVECYAYEKFEGVLLARLEEKMKQHAVTLKEVTLQQLFQSENTNRRECIDSVGKVMQTVISLAKGKRIKPEELIDLCNGHISQRPLAQLIAPIMSDYENYLRESGHIDFTDMLNMAEDYVKEGKFHHKYQYVIVDEYQDLSAGQFQLLKTLREDNDYTLFCVGDDWQSIYRFNGSDIGYIINFSNFWGESEISYIKTTYRFSQRLIDISGDFVMQNPNQIKKSIKSENNTETLVLGEINGYSQNAIYYMIERLQELPQNSSVFFIGRYRFDKDMLAKEEKLSVLYDNTRETTIVKLAGRPDLDMRFYTAHGSKGLQADYVFIINNKKKGMGFPSKLENPLLVELLLEQADQYPYAEERRLFYVALTRARKRVYLLTLGDDISIFAQELKDKYVAEIKRCNYSCPLCGAALLQKEGKYGAFWGCSNYSKTGCRFTRAIKARK